ncbi:MAG: endonuclease III domain-containing protein [Deltaproteobacteria bacterium]|nr:endonuclease III domain-containing protein [Deltaproteobacteria bacterium]
MTSRHSTYGKRRRTLESLYAAMLAHFGPSGWWPAKTPFEVALGAILTQNTSWTNVDKALAALDAATALVPDRIASLPLPDLEALIRPAGFFRQKSLKILAFLELLRRYDGLGHGETDTALACFAHVETDELRRELLAVSGIGPETADCILLYALDRPSFVVDAYTRRLCLRHGLVPESVRYDELREFFMDALEPDVALFNEYHALIVRTGKEFCRKTKPRCDGCPLASFLEYAPE